MAIKFGNAYVSDINVSFQWGGQGGSVQMTLVEDPDAVPPVVYADPPVGTPMMVECGNLSVGGILKRASYSESVSSGRTYDVVVESPSEFLDGIQIVLSDWNQANINTGATFAPYPNVINAFAYYENEFGFGEAGVNDSGMIAVGALQAVQTISQGGSNYGRIPEFGNFSYYLDLSQLINITPAGYRLSGPAQSLNSIVQDICEATGFDYYIDLTGGVRDDSTMSQPVTIRVVVIDKSAPPNSGAVSQYVASNQNALVSRENGSEYAVPTTHKVLVGGPVQRFITPFGAWTQPVWGKSNNGQWILGDGTLTPAAYSNPYYAVPVKVNEWSGSNYDYTATLFEVRLALAGRDSWETFKALQSGLGMEPNTHWYINGVAPWVGRIETSFEFIALSMSGMATSLDFMPTSSKYVRDRVNNILSETSSKIFSAVSRVASEYFGQVFLMPLQNYYTGFQADNVKFIQDDVVIEQSWDNVDAAFTTEKPFPDPAFYDGEGRLKGGAAFVSSSNADYSALGGDWCLTPDGGIATFKGGADKEIYWINGFPYCIVRSGGQVKVSDGLTTADYGFGVMWSVLTGDTSLVANPSYLTAGGQNLHLSVPPTAAFPSSYGIAQQSNKYKHGPWGFYPSVPGKAELVFDDSFVPENFGDFNTFNAAGTATAAETGAEPQANETGSMTFIGLPNFNIGQRFNGSGPYITSMSVQENSGGSNVTYSLSNWTPQRGKLARFNIDRIKKINKGMIADIQKRRSLVKKQPLPKVKFEKSDLGALKAAHSNVAPNFTLSFINEVTP